MTTPGPRQDPASCDTFVVALDRAGIVRQASPAALKLCGLTADDVTGRPFPDSPFVAAMPASRQRVRDALTTAAAGNIACHVLDIAIAGGGSLPVRLTFVPSGWSGQETGDTVLVTGAAYAGGEAHGPADDLRFLQRLSDATRNLANPTKIMEVSARLLGEHLDVSRAAYADVEDDNDTFTIRHDYTNGCDSTAGRYSLDLFGPRAMAAMRGGNTLVLRNIGEEIADDDGKAMFHSIGINAIVCCPLVKRGSLVAMMAVHQVTARDWSNDDIALVRDVAERCWASIERARAQKLLVQQERQFEDLFEFAPDALLMLDVEGCITLVNRRTEALFGFGRHELIGNAVETVVPAQLRDLHQQVCDSFADLSAVIPGLASAHMLEGRKKDGERFTAEVSLAPMETDQGPMVACSIRDATERNRLQAHLQHALKMETLGQMAGGIAHDFNNLLTVISATTELLIERNSADDALREELATILRAGEQATALTQQLLAMSSKQPLDPETVDLNDVLADIEPLLQRLVGENVALKLRQAADPVTTIVDRALFDQALLSLALHSRDSMTGGGTLIIETSNVLLGKNMPDRNPDLSPGPHAMLTISDTGPGMDEATRRQLFEPFAVAGSPDAGNGLGLPAVYGTVRQCGGSITAHSEPGKGTTIKVLLPRAAADTAMPRESGPRAETGTETILVIEDEQEILQVARIMLERRGYAVLTADDGVEALEIVRERGSDIDLVLSDVVMPGQSGPETVRQIRGLLPDVPVLYMSGYAADLIAKHGIERSPQFFLAKPFTLTELSRTVRQALDEQPARQVT